METGLGLERYFLVIRFSNINRAYKFYKKYEDSKYNRQLFDITVVTEDIKNVYESE